VYIHEVSFAHVYVCMCVYMYIHVCVCEQVGIKSSQHRRETHHQAQRPCGDKSGAQERQEELLRRFARVMMGHQAHTHTHTHTLREVVLL
jgi:hypothetical protein